MPSVGTLPTQQARLKGVQNQRSASQSEGDAAGARGSSYASTVPRIMPRKDGTSRSTGGGDKTATGRPRLVMVTERPSLPIS